VLRTHHLQPEEDHGVPLAADHIQRQELRMVLVETERLFIRQWVPDDWQRFRPLGTGPRVLEFLPTEPWSDEQSQRLINRGIEVSPRPVGASAGR
jgi:hypothetical protein